MKKISTAALCAAMLLTLTACSGGNDSGSSDGGSTPSSDTGSSAVSSPEDSSTPASGNSSTPAPSGEVYTLGGELTSEMIENSRYNVGNQVRLAKVIKKLQAGGEVTVAYLGGSITQGSSAGDEKCYARLTTNWLEDTFPNAKINYVRAGIGATGSYIGVHRADKDVLSHNPDLVFVDFSVNDTTERTEINKATYASLMKKLWTASSAPAIITIAMTQENGTSFQEYHGEIVKEFNIPMISYKNAILDIIDKGYIKWTDISGDNIHPNVVGHALLTDLITNYIQSVIDNVDSISGEEPDLSSVTGDRMRYVNAKLLMSDDTTPTSLGGFAVQSNDFGNFHAPWLIRHSDGQFTDADAIEFEFEGTNVGLLYGKLTKNSCMADIYIDGEVVKTINPSFPGGWGNYVEFEELATGLSEGKHTLKVAPKTQDSAGAFYVSAIAVS